jgi:hypothetical protein
MIKKALSINPRVLNIGIKALANSNQFKKSAQNLSPSLLPWQLK